MNPILTKILTLFLFITISTSFSQVTDEDYILINLTLADIENINTQEKNQKLEIINKHKNYEIAINRINKIDTVYLKKRLTKVIDKHSLNKIVLNCISKRDNCKTPIFTEKEVTLFYNLIFNESEIKHYKYTIEKSKGQSSYLKQKHIKSNKTILCRKKSTSHKNSFLSNILYTKDKKYAFLLYINNGKNRLYIFKKENSYWKIKWKKENLILFLRA